MSTAPAAKPDAFAVTERNRIRREHERGSYDRETVFAILDAGLLCHVAYVLGGQPYCTPTIHWREGDVLYWHGSSASRMLRGQKGGAPACLTVSHLDGLVLARSAFNHSVNYRSAMCFGQARLVADPEHKALALSRMVERYFPGRGETLRPMTSQELKATTVIAMPIDNASAKVRGHGVGDDDSEGDFPVWAGIVPLRTVIEAPQASPVMPAGLGFPEGLGVFAPGERLDQVFLATKRAAEARGG